MFLHALILQRIRIIDSEFGKMQREIELCGFLKIFGKRYHHIDVNVARNNKNKVKDCHRKRCIKKNELWRTYK